MRELRQLLLVAAFLPLASARAAANQDPAPTPPSLPSESESPVAPSLPEEPAEAGSPLEQEVRELRERLSRAEAEAQRESPLSIHGYVDFGFFAPLGNGGVGWVRDVANEQFPEFAGYSWTFLGDILGTTVNTRGEAADLGDAPGVDRFDSIDSDGAAGFLVNELNMRLGYQLAENALLRTSVNFVPRTGRQDFSLGDFMDVDLAELEYVLTKDGGTSLFVGKTLPVFGIEYKERKSDQRFGLTPSLMHRYTSGPQLGIKLRSRLLNDWVILAGSVTNNSSATEQFHFNSEVDKNDAKTLNGRAAVSVPIGDWVGVLQGDRIEVGASGEWGAQDFADEGDLWFGGDNVGEIWFWGADLQYLGANYALKAQFMRGKAPGRFEDRAWGLDLKKGGYLELNWQFLPFLGAWARADFRDAIVTLGMQRAYITKEMRYSGGLRVVFNPRVILKAEYLHNREFGGIRQFDHDIFTSSLVLAF